MRFILLFLTGAIMSGCVGTTPPSTGGSNQAETVRAQQAPEPDTARSALQQCTRDIESLRTVDAAQYRRFLAEYDALMKSSEGFLTVKDDVSPEVAALARPRFQYALVNLCWRVKNNLEQTLINQAGGGR